MRSSLLALSLLAGCATTSASTSGDQPASKPTATAEAPKKVLFERLGGKPAVEAVIDDFLGRVSKDELINSGFAVGHVPRLRQRLIELVCAASGGPCTYSGRDMVSAHAGMKITNAQFDALVGHLVATLDKFKVPSGEK
ncbi:MAG TPA: group 1 truncated hemoglobin, partial [Archangium sp.]